MIGVIFTIYGYARVSSKKQLHGNSIEEQTTTLTANGATALTTEQYTGKTTSRPKLQKLLDSLQPGDTLMVTKLDRLARNVSEGIELIRALFKKKCEGSCTQHRTLRKHKHGQIFHYDIACRR